jgi:hypothetical protein
VPLLVISSEAEPAPAPSVIHIAPGFESLDLASYPASKPYLCGAKLACACRPRDGPSSPRPSPPSSGRRKEEKRVGVARQRRQAATACALRVARRAYETSGAAKRGTSREQVKSHELISAV